MNCFVASAFDHEDVDAIYDHAIQPVLKELKLHPLRVDRVEHNDDIDDRIFSLIDQSLLCIADLTHARPSVYYEAGYAFGSGKPVIYLARKDHFQAREDDEPGNLRVHFDLQMKNIIPWTEPNEMFKKRLRSRLKYVLRPILRELQASHAKHTIEEHFASISQYERLGALLKKGKSLLHARGYKRSDSPTIGPQSLVMNPVAHLQKKGYRTDCHVYLLPRPAIKKSTFKDIDWLWPLATKTALKSQIEQITSLCVVISLRNARSATLTDLLSLWTPITKRIFTYEDVRIFRNEVPHSATVAVIDGISSVEDFADRFRPIVNEFEESQQEAENNAKDHTPQP